MTTGLCGEDSAVKRVVARSASESVESIFEIGRFPEPATSTMPEGDINPFEWHYCDACLGHCCAAYTAGDTVMIRGAKFKPNATVRLGIYRHEDLSVLSLVGERTATADAWGDFSTAVFVEASDLSGTYRVVPVTDPDEDNYDLRKAEFSCYLVR